MSRHIFKEYPRGIGRDGEDGGGSDYLQKDGIRTHTEVGEAVSLKHLYTQEFCKLTNIFFFVQMY